MGKVKVMSVFGTRPEGIKMAPLVKALEACPQIESVVCVTAQHRQMLDQVLEAFDIKPHFDLDIMEKSQTIGLITSKVISGMQEVLEQSKPDIVLVHGDTTTSFAAGLAAFYARTRVGHVEAGLRSFDKFSPYPEEMNRILTGKLADIHFCPTAANADNLRAEGVTENIYLTGNTVIDALKTTVKTDYSFECEKLRDIDFDGKKVILLTAHRRENYGKPFENIMSAVKRIAQEHEEVIFTFPVHLSPYVTETARAFLAEVPNVIMTEPLGVFDMHNLMSRVYMVMTDSGGLQEEAPAMGKPVLVLRNETERPEAVTAGTVSVVGTDEEAIYKGAKELLSGGEVYYKMKKAVNPYGDGCACQRIVQDILYCFGKADAPAEGFSPS